MYPSKIHSCCSSCSRRIHLPHLSLVIALLLTACGGGGSPTVTSSGAGSVVGNASGGGSTAGTLTPAPAPAAPAPAPSNPCTGVTTTLVTLDPTTPGSPQLSGYACNVDSAAKVVLYALTDQFYVQPLTAESAAVVMLDEVLDWRVVLEIRPLELPV